MAKQFNSRLIQIQNSNLVYHKIIRSIVFEYLIKNVIEINYFPQTFSREAPNKKRGCLRSFRQIYIYIFLFLGQRQIQRQKNIYNLSVI